MPTTEPHPLTGEKAPLILGHEFSGTIVEVGEGVTKFKVGDRVAPDACQVCWECYWCKRNEYNNCEKLAMTGLQTTGCFAEYINLPAYTCYKVPDGLPMDEAALVEPISVGMHAVRIAPVVEGDNVVVIGAGTIGLSALQNAWAAGAAQVIVVEMAKARKDFARELGATTIIDPNQEDVVKKVFELTDGVGADVTIECVGNNASASTAIATTRRAGTAVICGVFEKPATIDLLDVMFKSKKIQGSLGYNGEFAPVMTMLRDGRLKAKPMITGRIKLDDIVEKGFKELIEHKDENIKIIVSPN